MRALLHEGRRITARALTSRPLMGGDGLTAVPRPCTFGGQQACTLAAMTSDKVLSFLWGSVRASHVICSGPEPHLACFRAAG